MKRIKVNLTAIESLNPCSDRLANYVKHYGESNFTVKQFLALDNITHSDKCWVAFRLMPKKNIRFAAAAIAESVLPLYEAKYPDDKRPREAIKQAKAKRLNKEKASVAYTAAYAAYATTTATTATAAATAATTAAYTAATAATTAAYASSNRAMQEALNLKIIAKYWR